MNATEVIKIALDNSRNWSLGLLMDMKDTPLTQPTAQGGNHPLWILGHLTHSESQLLDVFILGRENRFPELAEKFGMGTEPTSNVDDYPSFDELMEKNELIRAAVMEHLASLSDEDLDKPTTAPAEQAAFFGTVAAALGAMTIHYGFHTGQIADARRAAGKPVLMA